MNFADRIERILYHFHDAKWSTKNLTKMFSGLGSKNKSFWHRKTHPEVSWSNFEADYRYSCPKLQFSDIRVRFRKLERPKCNRMISGPPYPISHAIFLSENVFRSAIGPISRKMCLALWNLASPLPLRTSLRNRIQNKRLIVIFYPIRIQYQGSFDCRRGPIKDTRGIIVEKL